MKFEQLDVWKRSSRLACDIYKALANCKDYGFKDQVTRSAISIPSNIAEGSGRNTWKELHQFRGYSIGSAAELDTQIIIAKKLNYLDDTSVQEVLAILEKTRKLLSGYKKYVKTKY